MGVTYIKINVMSVLLVKAKAMNYNNTTVFSAQKF